VALLPNPVSAALDVWTVREGLTVTREENRVMVNLTLFEYGGRKAVARTPLFGTYYGYLVNCPPFFEDDASAHYYATAVFNAAKFN
jgi:hypothetical protein